MAFADSYTNTTVTSGSTTTASGTYAWTTTDPFTYHYVESSPDSRGMNYRPSDLPADFEPIQGIAKGAKWLVSYAFKKSKDPVVFVKSEKDMLLLVQRLVKDEKVDQKTILIHKISEQFRPSIIEKKIESVELKPL